MNKKKLLGGIGLLGLGATGFGLAGMGPLAGLLGGAGAATALPEAALGALPEALPAATMPGMESMIPMTFPYGTAPAEDLTISGLEAGRQGALEPDMMQLAKRGMSSFARGMDGLSDPKAMALMQLAGNAQPQQAPVGGGQRPQAMPYQPTAGLLSPQQRKKLAMSGYLNG